MCTREPRLDLVSLPIGWRNGARILNVSPSEVMHSQSNSLITFDTQLKTALNQVSNIKWTPGQNWLLQNMSSVFVNPALQSKVAFYLFWITCMSIQHQTYSLMAWPNARNISTGHLATLLRTFSTFGQSTQNMSQHHATMLQDVVLKCCDRLARPLR